MHNRRKFLQKSSLLGAAALSLPVTNLWDLVIDEPTAQRQFTMQLDGGSIGVSAGQQELIDLADEYGFESVSAQVDYLEKISDAEREALLADMEEKNLVWGNAGLPVQFRTDQRTFTDDLKELPSKAKGLEMAGVTRITTWIMPNHPDLNYLQNFRQHAYRLREVAKILGDHGIRFGLEYVGPKTLQVAKEYPFMRSMSETKELIAAIGEPNMGFVLDSFHWYTAGEDVNDILTLNNSEVVACDLNDARSGYERDEQIDGKRELPMTTGVVDTQGFLNALIQINYDGPIRAEPFNQKLRDMEDEAAVKMTAEAMKRAFATVA